MSNIVLLERKGPVAVLTLNRPDALNALSTDLLVALRDTVRSLDGDRGVRALVLTGEPIGTEIGERIGLVNRAFEDPEALLAAAIAAGEKIAEKGPDAVALAKRVMQEGQDADVRVAHALEQAAFGAVFASEDRAEGMDAFLEKRGAKFEGR